MLIVCDSGSTKADWLVADKGKVVAGFSTRGLNPFFHTSADVLRELNKSAAARKYAGTPGHVYFFGAGCSSTNRRKVIGAGLRKFFKKARVTVEHDMLGAALAACHHERGIVCILGTGSNVAYYNGKRLSKTVHGLGYVLGDEGSGSYFGKKLVALYLYGRMPDVLQASFRRRYHLTRETAIRHVYHRPGANVYLASFAKFLSYHKRHPWIQRLVYQGLLEFYETNIAAYPQHKKFPVHFIGSIAYNFSEVLKKVGKACGFKTGNILVRPVDSLMDWYLGPPAR